VSEFTKRSEPTYNVDIFIAGELAQIEQHCQRFCARGLCVHVQPAEYVYTCGREGGARVGLINYPRFPKTALEIESVAWSLAEHLLDALSQRSCCVVTSEETTWISSPPTPQRGEE